MTRHIDAKASEDKSMADDEVLLLLEATLDFIPGGGNRDEMRRAIAAVAALQAQRDLLLAERDALRAEVEMHRNDAARLNGCPWRVQKGLQSECQPPKNMRESLAALEALRGQVAELMKFREGGLPTKGWLRDNDQSRRVLHELNELLAMTNSGEF